jgi:hypothetical protein
MNMIYVSLSAFTLAAIAGAYMLTIIGTEKGVSPVLILLHGILAASGFFSLVMVSLASTGTGLVYASVFLFAAAAAGGTAVFVFSALREPVPGALVSAHAVTAVIAYAMLLASLHS